MHFTFDFNIATFQKTQRHPNRPSVSSTLSNEFFDVQEYDAPVREAPIGKGSDENLYHEVIDSSGSSKVKATTDDASSTITADSSSSSSSDSEESVIYDDVSNLKPQVLNKGKGPALRKPSHGSMGFELDDSRPPLKKQLT